MLQLMTIIDQLIANNYYTALLRLIAGMSMVSFVFLLFREQQKKNKKKEEEDHDK